MQLTSLAAPGSRTCTSNAPDPTLNQLSYIPATTTTKKVCLWGGDGGGGGGQNSCTLIRCKVQGVPRPSRRGREITHAVITFLLTTKPQGSHKERNGAYLHRTGQFEFWGLKWREICCRYSSAPTPTSARLASGIPWMQKLRSPSAQNPEPSGALSLLCQGRFL